MQHDLTRGPITRTMLLFAGPMIAGNLLQQFYNIADTLIVGQFLGAQALAAVGSAFTLMTFLTSILLGLCMGSGAVFSIRYGERNEEKLKSSIFVSFVMIALVTLVMNLLVFLLIDPIIRFMNIPSDVYGMMRDYLWVIFAGIGFVFLYNYFAALLRAVGNSLAPLLFLAVSAVTNIVLDLLFVVTFQRGVAGAAEATVIAQALSAVGIAAYTFIKFPAFRPDRRYMKMNRQILREIFQYAFLTCIQQSVMNFGILLVQGLVNSFGTTVMAAFAAAVKIDAFAYMPVQDFGNAFSTFIAQNYGAKEEGRIREGLRGAVIAAILFCLGITAGIWLLARPLMLLFVDASETAIIAEGVRYLHIEGSFYCGIGCLFLLYGLYRAVGRPGMSVVLTVISLGTRVALAYLLSAIPAIGVVGIWWSVPIGWILADLTGLVYYRLRRDKLFQFKEPAGALQREKTE